jgi:ABC-2 type transport system permease protein
LATKNGLDGHTPADQRIEQLKQSLFRKYKVTSVEALPVSFRGATLQAGEDYGDKIFDTYFGGLWARFAKQEQVHLAGSLLAPILSVRSISMAFAGTDFAQHSHFAAAAEDYRRTIQRTINKDMTAYAGNGPGVYERGSELWNQVPPFQYEAPSVTWVLARQWTAFSLLFLWTAAAIVLAGWCASRLTVE